LRLYRRAPYDSVNVIDDQEAIQIEDEEGFEAGILFVVATPIGNMEDITLRALRILNECDLIVCEDTRVAKKLFFRHNISKPLLANSSRRDLILDLDFDCVG